MCTLPKVTVLASSVCILHYLKTHKLCFKTHSLAFPNGVLSGAFFFFFYLPALRVRFDREWWKKNKHFKYKCKNNNNPVMIISWIHKSNFILEPFREITIHCYLLTTKHPHMSHLWTAEWSEVHVGSRLQRYRGRAQGRCNNWIGRGQAVHWWAQGGHGGR